MTEFPALSKFSIVPITLQRDWDYTPEEGISEFRKPRGFWVSVDGDMDWPEWCETEEFYLPALTYRHIVRLKPDANIRMINTLEEFDAFEREFVSINTDWGNRWRSGIDWEKVARAYQGILITEYFWERRNSWSYSKRGSTATGNFYGYDRDLRPITVNWFYGWDCASGCIWDLSAIEAVTLAINNRPDGFEERPAIRELREFSEQEADSAEVS